MPVIINGTTGLSGVSTVNLANGSVTQNILANGVAGTGPSFLAYQSAAQSVTQSVWTKVSLQSEQWDTANCFDTSTYRFTPNVAGYYQLSMCVFVQTTVTNIYCVIYKNGGQERYLQYSYNSAGSGGSGLVYLNGTTDYAEFYTYILATQNLSAGSNTTWASGALVRAA